MTQKAIVQIRDLYKTYHEGDRSLRVLAGVGLDIAAGEFFAVLGASGSGKSTLLNLLSGIDNPDSGRILIDGRDITPLNDRQLTLFRRHHIGIVFQFFNLIPTLTVRENITLPGELSGARPQVVKERADDLLEQVGLRDRAATYPDKLSGGEQQRVAIARALLHEPKLVLADEPTGNLDEDTGRAVIQLLLRLTRGAGKTMVMATHSAEIARQADRLCHIHDGRLQVEARPSR